jgi:hypothetical protein
VTTSKVATLNCVDMICYFFLDEKVTKKSSRFETDQPHTWLGNSRFRPLSLFSPAHWLENVRFTPNRRASRTRFFDLKEGIVQRAHFEVLCERENSGSLQIGGATRMAMGGDLAASRDYVDLIWVLFRTRRSQPTGPWVEIWPKHRFADSGGMQLWPCAQVGVSQRPVT